MSFMVRRYIIDREMNDIVFDCSYLRIGKSCLFTEDPMILLFK